MIQLGGKYYFKIFIEFGTPLKLVRLIKMRLNEMYSGVCIGKYLHNNLGEIGWCGMGWIDLAQDGD
jgi:hypothetical protein